VQLLDAIEIVSAVAGAVLVGLLALFPRFGRASWILGMALIPGIAACVTLGAASWLQLGFEKSILYPFSFLILCSAGGCAASYTIEGEIDATAIRKRRLLLAALSAAAFGTAGALHFGQSPVAGLGDPQTGLALGPAGYWAAAYMLIASVAGVANLEQILRNANEYIRWEIKFLLLGMAAISAALIYVAAQVLLYGPRHAFLPGHDLRIFPIIFLCGCVFIFLSWRRSTGKRGVIVSQGIVYSTITLLSVGLYLVATSIAAGRVGFWAGSNLPIEPILFLISVMVLASVLTTTAFRHRVRMLIRRNIYSGRYDYRRLWMDATEQVRSIDSPVQTASALIQLIESALGSLDVSVWLGKPREMKLVLARGAIAEALAEETMDFSEALAGMTEPAGIAELNERGPRRWPTDFLERSKASLIAPLISSGRTIGLLTVGADRSGGAFDREAREFLRVLAVHAAGEFHKNELLNSLIQTREAEAFETFSTFLLHDLKNFASSLSLIAKNAVRHHGNPDFQLDAFQCVFETAEKMRRLCNGLRTFSADLAANKKLEDINVIVRDVLKEFDPGLCSRVRLDFDPVPLAEIDRQEFGRVLQNLILNAAEASTSGPIEVSTRANTSGIVVCVSDKGSGIPKEFLEKQLFQPFRTTKVEGLGIGLFQCKKIIECHNGTIEVESREGEGTLVRIVLPVPVQPLEAHSTPTASSAVGK
jgi:putative PEP-CTERM system histidine kinase